MTLDDVKVRELKNEFGDGWILIDFDRLLMESYIDFDRLLMESYRF